MVWSHDHIEDLSSVSAVRTKEDYGGLEGGGTWGVLVQCGGLYL